MKDYGFSNPTLVRLAVNSEPLAMYVQWWAALCQLKAGLPSGLQERCAGDWLDDAAKHCQTAHWNDFYTVLFLKFKIAIYGQGALGWNHGGLFQEHPKGQQQPQLGSLGVEQHTASQENGISIIIIFIEWTSCMKMALRPLERCALAFQSERKQYVLLHLPDHTMLII